jgi:predicted DNA-binding protein
MTQITVNIPDDLGEVLKLLLDETGRTQSGLCAIWIREGIYKEVKNLNKIEVYKSLLNKRRKPESQEETQ